MHSLHRKASWIVAGLAVIAAPVLAAGEMTIAKGTTVDLALEQSLTSSSARVNDTFRAKLVQPLYVDGQMALPANTVVHGRVDSVR